MIEIDLAFATISHWVDPGLDHKKICIRPLDFSF